MTVPSRVTLQRFSLTGFHLHQSDSSKRGGKRWVIQRSPRIDCNSRVDSNLSISPVSVSVKLPDDGLLETVFRGWFLGGWI